MWLLLLLLGRAAPQLPPAPAPPVDAASYLLKFGYLSPPSQQAPGGAHHSPPDASLAQGLRRLQEFAGVQVTGVLDNATLEVPPGPLDASTISCCR